MRPKRSITRCLPCLWLACAGVLAGAAACAAQDAAESTTLTPVDELILEEEQLGARFRTFEQVLLRLAKLTESTDPERASLLRKAFAQSKERLLDTQFSKLVDLLKEGRLASAVGGQASLEDDLVKLLDLLLSEERSERIKEERERIKEQIRRINEMISRQTQLEGQSANSDDLQGLSSPQGRLADDAQRLSQSMREANDRRAAENASEGQAASPPSGEEANPTTPSETPGEPSPSGANTPSDSSPSTPSGSPNEPSSDPSQSSPSPGQPSQPSNGQSSPGQESSPSDQVEGDAPENDPNRVAQERVASAERRMRAAQGRLERAERDGAVDEQEEALRELERAKAELEKVLRQLREEELGRTLAMLEARFKKMREMQLEVYEGTKRLDAVVAAERDRDDEIESSRLSRKEAAIVVEADKALLLLKEDATSTAFPEAVEQMRFDMLDVTDRLSRFDVGRATQTIEEDILAALEEMTAALENAQQQLEEQKSQQEQPPGEPQDPALVDQLAEVKLIRSLQARINSRTSMYAQMVADDPLGQASQPELLEALGELAEREARVHRATRNLVEGEEP